MSGAETITEDVSGEGNTTDGGSHAKTIAAEMPCAETGTDAMSGYSEAALYRLVTAANLLDAEIIGMARAEIERRKRAFDDKRDARREEHDLKMLQGRGRQNTVQQNFARRLAREQIEHATKLADKQLAAARHVAWATIFAALAAVAAAVTTILQVFLHR